MIAWKYFTDSIIQGVKPEKYYPRLSQCFLITKSYSDREIKVSENAIKLKIHWQIPKKNCFHAWNFTVLILLHTRHTPVFLNSLVILCSELDMTVGWRSNICQSVLLHMTLGRRSNIYQWILLHMAGIKLFHSHLTVPFLLGFSSACGTAEVSH